MDKTETHEDLIDLGAASVETQGVFNINPDADQTQRLNKSSMFQD
ncbi:benenodin family lasso peptide [Asticcacaulis sp.]